MEYEDNIIKDKMFGIIPLNCLCLNFTFKFLVDCIISYSIINSILLKNNIKDYDNSISYKNIEKWAMDIYEQHEDVMDNSSYDLYNHYLRYKIIFIYNKRFTEKYEGNDAKILIYIDLLNDILKKNVLTERQFRILCAIYSSIGKRPYKIIYNDEISIRALGYRNKDIYLKEKENSLSINKLYSKKILSNEILLLSYSKFSHNFFDRFRDGRRYYYSRYIRGKKLEDIVTYKLHLNRIRRQKENNRYKNMRKNLIELSSRDLTKSDIKNFEKINENIRKYSYAKKDK